MVEQTEEEQKAYSEGYEAYIEGQSDLDNPYESIDSRCLSWNDGYIDAEEEGQ